MNVTDKQKQILLEFMKLHPDFGRGRIRSKGESKKQLDQLWAQLSEKLNSAGCGPRKTAKEWAKNWRDWKSNVLKKVAVYKSYASGTGGGSPKKLRTSPLEDELLAFMTPDASGLTGIPEGGFGDSFESPDNSSLFWHNTQPSTSSSHEAGDVDWMSYSVSQEPGNPDEDATAALYCDASSERFERDILRPKSGPRQKRLEQSTTTAQPQESLPPNNRVLRKKNYEPISAVTIGKENSNVRGFQNQSFSNRRRKTKIIQRGDSPEKPASPTSYGSLERVEIFH